VPVHEVTELVPEKGTKIVCAEIDWETIIAERRSNSFFMFYNFSIYPYLSFCGKLQCESVVLLKNKNGIVNI
jgi:hypothetical protein